MARRRTHTPPFEIMGKGPAAPPRDAEDAPTEPAAAPQAWWRSFDEPVVLRVPRGLAVLMLLAVLGLVVLAYWVGNQRGITQGKREVEQRLAGHENLLRPRPAPPAGDGTEPVREQPNPRPGQDAREPGLNYFVLVSYPPGAVGREQAERLVAFLGQYGVEAAAVIGDNERFLHVVALRGFKADELGSPAVATYRQKLLSIGRDWKTAHGGRGNDLSDLYLDKYERP